jgi:uncharacterized protein YoxC
MSEPSSPISYGSPSDVYSDIATEPLPPTERQLVHEYMSRRQHFLFDYERYSPVQNMQMLANHVFELSENVHHLRGDFTGSRRVLSVVSDNQRTVSNSVKEVGQDVEVLGRDLYRVGQNVDTVKDDVGGLRHELNTLRSEMHSIRQETINTQMGIQELKNMLSMMVGVRA